MQVLDAVETKIQKARKLLSPPKVDRASVPSWIRPRVREAMERGDLPDGGLPVICGSANEAFEHATRHLGEIWADHCGRIKVGGKQVLVSEPYWETLSDSAKAQLDKFCKV